MNLNKISSVEVSVEETYEGEQFQNIENKTLEKLARSVQIPGFRKGKAPVNLVRNYVNQSYLQEMLVDEIVDDVLRSVASELEAPVYKVHIKESSIEEQKAYIKMVIELLPQPRFDDIDFSELPPYEEPKVTEEEIEDVVDHLLEDQSVIRSVEVEKPEDGYLAEIEWALLDEQGNPLKPRRTTIEIGKEEFLEGTDDLLKSMTVGEEKTMATPDGESQIRIKLLDIKGKVKPELTDELAADLGFENVENLRKAAEEEIRRYKLDQYVDEWLNNVLDDIAEQLEIQLPPSMIEDEYEHRYEEFINMLENSGLNLESYASQVQKTPDEVLTEIRENVTKSLKRYFVLEFLKSALGIEADEAEVNEYLKTRQGINRQEARYNVELEKLIEVLKEKVSANKEV
ncbi:MAG TPA: trigger factor [Coprothermobacter proteolyticus]|nr:trigger factor [Coprothermobacter proteolyticus]HOA64859.1 trigger factor [Coprothermobacter proteolyticus]HOK24509.1 trigger factor [Coprothermobacter proteolyticus]HOL52790.1 trigger factor [Coprothermobacter proteolyticus]HOP45677.1 trigger factor [Coprothermobacter proteolyticus]